jgi:hypothetical protein
MKRIALVAALMIVSCPLAFAQAKPAAPEAAKPEAQAPAKAAPQLAKATRMSAKKSRRAEDARHCLEKASNNEIIKCAEEFL